MSKKKAKKKARKSGRKGSAKGMTKKKKSAAARKAAKTRAAKKAKRVAAGKKAWRNRKGGGKKARKGKGRKSAKRSAAARKGARTRKRNMAGETKSQRSKAAKKGARKGKRKGGKRRSKPDVGALITRNKAALASVEARYALKLANEKAKLEKASGAEKNRIIKRLENLVKERDMEVARIRKQQERSMWKEKDLLAAAEGRRRSKGKKRRKGSKRDKNPIGSGGMVEYAAVTGGVLTAIAMTIIPYRMLRSHALTDGGAQGSVDAPVQGDVPNLLSADLPLWSRLKWKGAIALGVVLVGDIAMPLFVASRIKTSDGWKTFFQLWGWTSVALGTTKLVVDVLAMATKSTSLGQRLFASENTARDVRALSATAKLPPITVAPGLGLTGLTAGGFGYGNPDSRHTGAAGCGCGDCEAKRKALGANPPVGTQQPITGPTPMPAQPGQVQPPGGQPLNYATNPNAAPGAAGAPGSVTPINKFAPKSRFDSKSRFGNQ